MSRTNEQIKIDRGYASELQKQLIADGFLTGKPDGRWGPISREALLDFKAAHAPSELGLDGIGPQTEEMLSRHAKPWTPSDDFAGKVIQRMDELGLKIFCGSGIYNIVYVEGVGANLKRNSDKIDHFNDVRLVIQCHEGKAPVIVGRWEATSEPGLHYTKNRMNAKGAARIAIDTQFKAWAVGIHGWGNAAHEALVQTGPIKVHRDSNNDGLRTGDPIDIGNFGINQHHGYDNPKDYVGRASAGCLVGRTTQGHEEFMALIKRDVRYRANSRYWFWTSVLDGSKFLD